MPMTKPETENASPGLRTAAQFRRKETAMRAEECVVEKVVELDAPAFREFRKHLTRNYGFLAEHRDAMRVDSFGVIHCLLVLGEGWEDGILVNSEGSSYARYSALLPNARSFLKQQEPKNDRYEDLCGRLAGWLNESEVGADLYDTLHREIGMTDEEICEIGFSSLMEYAEHGQDEGQEHTNTEQDDAPVFLCKGESE